MLKLIFQCLWFFLTGKSLKYFLYRKINKWLEKEDNYSNKTWLGAVYIKESNLNVSMGLKSRSVAVLHYQFKTYWLLEFDLTFITNSTLNLLFLFYTYFPAILVNIHHYGPSSFCITFSCLINRFISLSCPSSQMIFLDIKQYFNRIFSTYPSKVAMLSNSRTFICFF